MELLVDREDSLRAAVDFIPQGLAVFDRDLRLVTANNRYRTYWTMTLGAAR